MVYAVALLGREVVSSDTWKQWKELVRAEEVGAEERHSRKVERMRNREGVVQVWWTFGGVAHELVISRERG